MTTPSLPSTIVSLNTGTTAERRAAVQLAEQEREAERQKQLAAQASPLNPAEERIRIWERLHSLRLPLAPTHRLVRVIATQTELSVSQVQQEQQRRAANARHELA